MIVFVIQPGIDDFFSEESRQTMKLFSHVLVNRIADHVLKIWIL